MRDTLVLLLAFLAIGCSSSSGGTGSGAPQATGPEAPPKCSPNCAPTQVIPDPINALWAIDDDSIYVSIGYDLVRVAKSDGSKQKLVTAAESIGGAAVRNGQVYVCVDSLPPKIITGSKTGGAFSDFATLPDPSPTEHANGCDHVVLTASSVYALVSYVGDSVGVEFLYRVPIAGGAPQKLDDDVMPVGLYADDTGVYYAHGASASLVQIQHVGASGAVQVGPGSQFTPGYLTQPTFAGAGGTLLISNDVQLSVLPTTGGAMRPVSDVYRAGSVATDGAMAYWTLYELAKAIGSVPPRSSSLWQVGLDGKDNAQIAALPKISMPTDLLVGAHDVYFAGGVAVSGYSKNYLFRLPRH